MSTAFIERQALSDTELQQAIDTCAQEPIHICGLIQPHGYMLVMDEAMIIRHISANFPSINGINARARVETPLNDLIEQETINELKELVVEGALNPLRSTTLNLRSDPPIHCDAIIHRSGNMLILELEPIDEERPLKNQDLYRELTTFSIQLQKVQDQQTLYDHVVGEVRRITGFARVKLYQFDEDWNGTVVAESKEPQMPSYLGLHFPSTDIPKQARTLFARNYLRMLPDIHYEPVGLLPDDKQADGEPLDLSFSVLRSTSRVHARYLDNMGISASMAVSLMQNDKLWGMISCHHDKPYYVPYRIRMGAELFAHTFSAFLSSLTHASETADMMAREASLNELSATLSFSGNLMDVFKDKYSLILKAVKADGVIIHLDGKYYAFGLIPEMSSAKELIGWLEKHHDERVFATDSIVRDTNLAIHGQSMASGVLAVPVSATMTDYVMWFREEQASQVNWAGKPEKKITADETGFHLTPRASFNRWKENLRGVSAPWTKSDTDAANAISKMLVTKKYEEVLRQKNEDLNSILNHSDALIYITNTDGIFMSINDKALEEFGLVREEVAGHTLEEVFDGKHAALVRKHDEKVLAAQSSMTFEKDFLFKGKEFHLISVKFPLYDSLGDIYALCTISTDISALRQTEAELVQSNKELERMAFIASHDLQEPLRLISNFTQMLQEQYGGQLDDKADKYINYTVSATQRMKHLISDLLEYSKLSNEEGEEIEIIDAQKELESLIQDIYGMQEDQQADIICHGQLPKLPIKASHFSCLMQNLIGNGLKYAKKDVPPKVEISIKETNSVVTIAIKDNGIGIKSEYFDKVFMIFRRLHTQDEYPGTGIGLALCKRIIEGYGGKIWLDSQPDEGSTFYISIPKEQKPSINKEIAA